MYQINWKSEERRVDLVNTLGEEIGDFRHIRFVMVYRRLYEGSLRVRPWSVGFSMMRWNIQAVEEEIDGRWYQVPHGHTPRSREKNHVIHERQGVERDPAMRYLRFSVIFWRERVGKGRMLWRKFMWFCEACDRASTLREWDIYIIAGVHAKQLSSW